MESITEHLIINCVSHFTFGVRFGFKMIELDELDETMNACKEYFDEKLEKFKSVLKSNGFRYCEVYETKTVTFSEDTLGIWCCGDLHEPFTDYLVEKLKADARLEITTKS